VSASLAEKAKLVRTVFLVPPRSDDVLGRLARHSDKLGQPTKAILEAFTNNTRALLRTLSIPFQLICSQVNALHFQRLRLAERIRLGFEVEEAEGDRLARESAQKRMVEFHGSEAFVAEVLSGLEQLLGDSDSSTAAHELSRQGLLTRR
jgi:hypothetical protein